jgi:hypothetical protein
MHSLSRVPLRTGSMKTRQDGTDRSVLVQHYESSWVKLARQSLKFRSLRVGVATVWREKCFWTIRSISMYSFSLLFDLQGAFLKVNYFLKICNTNFVHQQFPCSRKRSITEEQIAFIYCSRSIMFLAIEYYFDWLSMYWRWTARNCRGQHVYHFRLVISLVICKWKLCSIKSLVRFVINPLNAKLNPICYLLALLGAHHILHVSRVRVKC